MAQLRIWMSWGVIYSLLSRARVWGVFLRGIGFLKLPQHLSSSGVLTLIACPRSCLFTAFASSSRRAWSFRHSITLLTCVCGVVVVLKTWTSTD